MEIVNEPDCHMVESKETPGMVKPVLIKSKISGGDMKIKFSKSVTAEEYDYEKDIINKPRPGFINGEFTSVDDILLVNIYGALPEPVLSPNAESVITQRYLQRDKHGKVCETPKHLFWRVALDMALDNFDYYENVDDFLDTLKDYYHMMINFDFLPNSPTLMNAGTGTDLGYMACYVLPVEDSMEGIFQAIMDAALIHKGGGGCFKKGTKIALNHWDSKNIEDVQVGDSILTYNIDLDIFEPGIVENTFKMPISSKDIIELTLEDDSVYYMTSDHPVGVIQNGNFEWIEAGKLTEDMDIINFYNYCPICGSLKKDHRKKTCSWDCSYKYRVISKTKKYGEDYHKNISKLMNASELATSPTQIKSIKKIKETDSHYYDLNVSNNNNYVLDNGTLVHNTGFSFTRLRPKDSIVGTTGGVASGPLSFLKIFDTATEQVKQGGKRRGANMGILQIDHPDILEFISAKEEEGQLVNFNLSVALTEDFMKKVEAGEDYPLIAPHNKAITGYLNAKEVFELLVKKAWQSGDPGIIFIDRINKDNPTPDQGPIESTNPCVTGDTPLLTDKGYFDIADLVGQKVNTWNGEEWSEVEPKVTGYDQEVLSITFMSNDRSDIRSIKATLYHKFDIVVDGKIVTMEAKDLEEDMQLAPFKTPYNDTLLYYYVFDISKIEEKADKVYCFTEHKRNKGVFNGLLLGNCGEVPLLPYEACVLGSINLGNFVNPDKTIDWGRLAKITHRSTQFLDSVINRSKYPIPAVEESVKRNRKIGLGVMGWADMLFELNISYGSEEAVELGRKIMDFIKKRSLFASIDLAEKLGPFPAFETSTFKDEAPRRNATLTTIAPTGTLSIIADCSSGIEPLFALSFYRITATGERLPEVNKRLVDILEAGWGPYAGKMIEEITKTGSIQDISEIPHKLKEVYITAMEISPESHLEMQAAFQESTDNAVSKTVNLLNSATEQDIYDIYWLAYTTGCKGVTVYRDGCKNVQFLYTGDGAKEETPEEVEEYEISTSAMSEEEADNLVKEWKEKSSKILQEKIAEKTTPTSRPNTIYGFTRKVKTGLGELYLTVNEIDGKPFEVFAIIGRSGRSTTAKAEAIGRLVSLALRSGVPVKEVVKQLKGIGGEHPVFQKKGMLLSIPDAIGSVLERHYLKDIKVQRNNSWIKDVCPDCDNPLIFQEGCFNCKNCGFTKCG